MTTGTVVIDVSHWQGEWPGPDTPWEAMKNAGIVGVILKATEGESWIDDTFESRYAACKERGVAVCSYHFLRHGDIERQMEHFIGVVQPVSGERMVLDWEDPDVTLDELKRAVELLLTVNNDGDNANLQVTVYGSSSFLMENVPNAPDTLLAGTSLWVARYSDEEPYWPDQVWPTWSLWQCTDRYYLPNYGPLDGNRFNGTVEACIEWLNPAAAEPVPKPEPDPERMLVDYNVRVSGQAVAFDIVVQKGVAVAVRVNEADWRPPE